MNRPIEPKINQTQTTEIRRPVSVANPVTFNTTETVFVPEPQRMTVVEPRRVQVPMPVYEQQFHHYSANQPQPVRIENNGPGQFNYEQQFHKYSQMNPPV